MKICLIGPAPPLRGGIAHYNTQLALELGSRHDVCLISFSRQYPSLLFPGRTQLDPAPTAPGPAAEALLDSVNPLSWLRAGRRVAALAPDLAVVHWWNPFFGPCIGAMLRAAKRRRRIPFAFICHNVVPHESLPGSQRLTRFALAAGDAWLVHSGPDRLHLQSLGLTGPVLVAPAPPGRGFGDPINREEAQRRLGLSGRVLLFFGLIRRYKGLPDLLMAMPQVLRSLECTLLVVGEFYEGKGRCLHLIDTLGIGANVRVIDRFIPDQEVSLYFSAADLVVLPYESATQSGIVPIAYAFERPVVGTRVGGLPESVRDGETGILVEPHDPGALAEAVIRFYRNDLEKTFKPNVTRACTTFTWADLAGMIESLLPAGLRPS